jgi:hypothetical protein
VTTKVYDPSPTGSDAATVQKVHELLYGGPGFDPTSPGGLSMSNPHPESLMGFIGKPSDFWAWAADATGSLGAIGFSPEFLPPWAQLGVPAADPTTTGNWKHGGTFLFDTVAAAHCFPEYFWIGSGYGRFLAWGIFEGAGDPLQIGVSTPDKRLITRGRVHIPRCVNGATTSYQYAHHAAEHEQAKEFITNSQYHEPTLAGNNHGRHMWGGKTIPIPMDHPFKPGAYTYAKTPRYYNNESAVGTWEDASSTGHTNDSYLPYEVGPLARMMSNAALIGGGPANSTHVGLVDAGQVGLYYPGILADVDSVLAPGGSAIGVFPGFDANLKAHLEFLGVDVGNGSVSYAGNGIGPVFYLPPNALNVGEIFAPGVGAVGNGNFQWNYFGDATLDRIAARTLETYFVGMQMLDWFNQLDPPAAMSGALKNGVDKGLTSDPDDESYWDEGYNPDYPYDSRWPNYTLKFGPDKDKPAPYRAQGAGLTEAPRGALGHWIRINEAKVYNYQIITPTTWNINPKDAADGGEKTLGLHGPIEFCILNTPLVNDAEPIEILRVIHSFDPCCACTVHVMDAKKEKKFEGTLEPLI